jgi:hypothetical protein
MPPTANIVKAVYLNHELWPEVDTTTIAGVLRARGPTPSHISFSVNRHFDTDKTTNGLPLARSIRHLDNIKIVIVPADVFYNPAGPFHGQFPQTYDGSGNLEIFMDGGGTLQWRNGNGGICDQWLAWQGCYVEPSTEFDADGAESFSESYAVTCYDYRWCLNRSLFRTPPVERHLWESGITTGGATVGWNRVVGSDGDSMAGDVRQWGAVKQNALQFTYNDIIPKGGCNPQKSWTLIVEHILRTAARDYSAAADGSDPGMIWSKIPTYSGFAVNPHVAGLRVRSDNTDYVLTLKTADGQYPPLANPVEIPYAPQPQNNTDRAFVPDPITIQNTFLLNAIQQVLDTTGMFDMFMDAFNTLRFIRNTPPGEITIPDDDREINDFGDVYRARFADTFATPPDAAQTLSACNVRKINLVPRAVPEANRVVGTLVGRAKLASNILNPRINALQRSTDDFSPTWYQTTSEETMRNHVRYNSAHATVRRFSHKVYGVDARVAVPVVTPIAYQYKNRTGENFFRCNNLTIDGSYKVLRNGTGHVTSSDIDAADALEITVYSYKADTYVKYRFILTWTTSRASVEIKSTRKTGTDTNPDFRNEGGHVVQLVGDSYKRFDLMQSISAHDNSVNYSTGITTVYINCYFDCVNDNDASVKSNHRSHFATNAEGATGENVCAYAMGTLPTAESYVIDSAVGSYAAPGDWDGHEEAPVGDDGGFPGLGEYTRSVIDADPVAKSVQDLIPQDTPDDDANYLANWAAAKENLKKLVKSVALQKRQLITEGTLTLLYDKNLRLDHRLCVVGTRDDVKEATDKTYWMRLARMLARINQISIDADDELTLELTTREAVPEFSLLNYSARL